MTNGIRAAIKISVDFEMHEDIFTLGPLFVLQATALLLIVGKLHVPAPGSDSFFASSSVKFMCFLPMW